MTLPASFIRFVRARTTIYAAACGCTPGKPLTDFKSEFIRDLDYSGGKQLAIIRGTGKPTWC
jgi:hypothetical protein